MSFESPTSEELALVAAAREGKAARFEIAEGKPKPVLDARLIRALALGLPIPGATTADAARPHLIGARIHVVGAEITGLIDLEGMGAIEGQGALSLILEQCSLTGPGGGTPEEPAAALNLSGARLGRLSLKQSRFACIDLRGANIASDLDATLVRPLTDAEDAPCWVRARSLTLGGNFFGDGAMLRIKPRAKRIGSQNNALELTSAHIRGMLRLDRSTIDGCLQARNAQIGGDVWIRGAHLAKGEDDEAIFMKAVKVGGGVYLMNADDADGEARAFICSGAVLLDFAEIGGQLHIAPAYLGHPPEGDQGFVKNSIAVSAWAVRAAWLSIGEGANNRFGGCLVFGRSQFAGNVDINARVHFLYEGQSPDEVADGVRFEGASVGGSFIINYDAVLNAPVRLDQADINRDLKFHGEIRPARGACAISAEPVRVKGDVHLDGRAAGEINFNGAVIDGIFRVGSKYRPLQLGWRRGARRRISLRDARIVRALEFCPRQELRPAPFDKPDKEGALFEAPPPGIAQARARSLDAIYPGWSLVEVQLEQLENETPPLRTFLVKDDGQAGEDLVIALDGQSAQIHRLNEKLRTGAATPAEEDAPPTRGFEIKTIEQAKEYLLFFCSQVWGDEGAFTVLEQRGGLSKHPSVAPLLKKITSIEPVVTADEEGFKANVYIVYGAAVFKAMLAVKRTGEVEMTDDEAIGQLKGDPPIIYNAPSRFARKAAGKPNERWQLDSPYEGDGPADWPAASSVQRNRIGVFLDVLNRGEAIDPACIDCSGAYLGLLDDLRGEGWPAAAKIILGGLTYERLPEAAREPPPKAPARDPAQAFGTANTRNAVKASNAATTPQPIKSSTANETRADDAPEGGDSSVQRIEWLRLQYENRAWPTERGHYNPQPFEQMIAALYGMGDSVAARRISRTKLGIEQRLRAPGVGELIRRLSLLFWIPFGYCFGYGLAPARAFGTFLLCWFGGAWVAHALSGAPPWTFVGMHLTPDINPALLRVNDGAIGPAACGSDANAIWYALDTFVPLIDLQQEGRCDIDPARWGWVTAKSLYALFGWLVTSLALLTMSGLLRRYAERS